jgi:hypothetical protein
MTNVMVVTPYAGKMRDFFVLGKQMKKKGSPWNSTRRIRACSAAPQISDSQTNIFVPVGLSVAVPSCFEFRGAAWSCAG